MTTSYKQPGNVLDHTNAGSAIASGDVVVMSSLVGVALAAIAAGGVGSVAMAGVFELAKLSTDTIEQGQVVYWDTANDRVTETPGTGKVAMGKAAAAAGNGATTVPVLLNV